MVGREIEFLTMGLTWLDGSALRGNAGLFEVLRRREQV
jgi:hypothetical protein